MASTVAFWGIVVLSCSGKVRDDSELHAGAGASAGASASTVAGARAVVGASGDGSAEIAGAPSSAGAAGSIEPLPEAGAPGTAGTAGTAGMGHPTPVAADIVCNTSPPTDPPLLSGGTSCAAGCRQVVAFPRGVGKACIDTSAGELVSCSCGTQTRSGVLEGCLKSNDGRLWLVAGGMELDLMSVAGPAAAPPAQFDRARFSGCSASEAASIDASNSCDFASCGQSVLSHCSAAATTAGMWHESCDGSWADATPAFNRFGCLKQQCVSDTDCGTNERCVNDGWSVPRCNFDESGECRCDIEDRLSVFVCMNVALAGPRGPWQSYRIDDATTGKYWVVTPDGKVVSNSNGTEHQATATSAELGVIASIVDTAYFRRALTDGFVCSTHHIVAGKVTLKVDGKEYVRDVSNCLYFYPAGDQFMHY